MATIKSSSLWAKKFNSLIKDILAHKYTEFVLPGGRGSTKSSVLSLIYIILLINNPEYNGLIVRKVSNTLRDSVYNQIKWAVEKLGLEHLFNFTLAPLQATYTPTGQTIYFRGADDPLKIKSIKTTNGYIALLWLEELAEFSFNDLETIKLSSMRGGSTYYNFYSYNPPSSARNWVNTEMRKPRADRLIFESSYLDIPPEWLGDAFIFEAEEMKKSNPRAYDNIFLGKPTGSGTNVFENIEIRAIKAEELDALDWHYYGLDFGYFPDPLRFVAMAYDMNNKTLFIYDEMSLLKHGNYEASEKLKKHLENKNIDFNIRITADSAEPKSVNDFRTFGFNCRGAIKGRGSLEAGFKWLQSLNKIIIDPINAPKSADEFSLYEYEIDKKTGDVLSGYPQGQADHSLAACRYALEEVWTKRGN